MIKVVEVGLRDGLQNEKLILPTHKKIALLQKLIAAGVKEIEVTSFVHPTRVPQLADADLLASQLPFAADVNYRALVPNKKGMKRAIQMPIHEYAVYMSASESHNRKNVQKGIAETFPILKEVVEEAAGYRKKVRGYVSTVFGCPYEGRVPPSQVVSVCEELFKIGIYEISLGDTIGVATPTQVKEMLTLLSREFPVKRLAVHFHDTRGTGLVNAYVALECGITTIDSALGGLGGCPYAFGASGNLATEDLVYMLHGMGIETGIDLGALCETSRWLERELGKKLPSKVLQSYPRKKHKS